MIPGPFPWSDCFLTDQRDFASHIHAKSRMHSEARIDLTTSPPKLTQWRNCGWTTECDCGDGEEECRKRGDASNMKFKLSVNKTTAVFTLQLDARAFNPCSPSSQVGGEIDMRATFTIDPAAKHLTCSAIVDSFPAFEADATVNDGAGVAIFLHAPPSGNTLLDLPGEATTHIKTITLIDKGGGVLESQGDKRSPESERAPRIVASGQATLKNENMAERRTVALFLITAAVTIGLTELLAMGYVVARDGFGRGDLLPFLVWAAGLGMVVAAMATALQTRDRGWSAPTRAITRSTLGAATGYLWCVMMAWSMGPWFGTLSSPGPAGDDDERRGRDGARPSNAAASVVGSTRRTCEEVGGVMMRPPGSSWSPR